MSTPKLCKDCRWCDRNRLGLHALCRRPTGRIDLVTGIGIRTLATCAYERAAGSCGVDARHYLPRPSRLRRILAALGLATLPGCAGPDAEALMSVVAVGLLMWVVVAAARLRRRWA